MGSTDETVVGRPPESGRPAVAGAVRVGSNGRVDEPVGELASARSHERERIGLIGKRLGRFLITAELGRGGMATVYRARDPQLGRDVALKVMHGVFAGRPELEARFRREASAVAAIRHPSILSLYEFAPACGEEPGYIVSELIEGPGLRQLVESRGGRLLPEVAMLVGLRIAEALAAAHAAGIVHRDVKPDNVLIDYTAGGGARVVLTDFGVAHVNGLDTMTATGAVLGSPAYMSPEQARGDDVGPPSDVFSLGVLMYQLSTGHLPYSGKDPLTVISAILRGTYLRPSMLEARVGHDWEQIITRCLAPDPAARFKDGTEVAAALRELARSAELTDDRSAFHRFLADAEVFERELVPCVAAQALGAAELARRRRQIPRALAEVGRALAYAPDDVHAREMLRRLSSRRYHRGLRAGVLAGISVISAAALAAAVLMAGRPPDRGMQESSAKPLSTASHPALGTTMAIDSTSGSTQPSPMISRDDGTHPPSVRETSGAPARPRMISSAGAAEIAAPPLRRSSRGTRLASGQRPGGDRPLTASRAKPSGPDAIPHSTASPAVVATTTGTEGGLVIAGAAENRAEVAAAPVEPGSGVKAPPGKALTEIKPSAEESTQTGGVVLRASHGFCEPSLDDHPPSLRASYRDLAPGPHEIFCTLPQGGGKIHVATYDLRPGRSPSLIIVPGSDGRPSLGHPE